MEKTTLKLKNLIKNAAKFHDMQFRLLLEELVKEGGREAENLVGEFAQSRTLNDDVRINIIRCMGYTTSTTFLFALKKILEADDNLHLRKAAIISISKYNDKRALNLLNSALKTIDNPILQDSINTEISRIKRANPILSLLPRFLKGMDDPKTFRSTLQVLKKILDPNDAQVFIYHLNSEVPFVGDGAFEVLCWRGDESVKFSIFDFFRAKLKEVDCMDATECLPLQDLLGKIKEYLVRNPDTINYVLKELKTIYKESGDPRAKEILTDIFSSNHKREVLSFMEDIYNNEPERRESVIAKLHGNDHAAYVLIYKYKNDPRMKKQLTLGLTTTQNGANFIMQLYDSLEPAYKKLIAEHITPANYHFFKPLIEQFLRSDKPALQKFALEKISQSHDSSFHSVLFDPKHDKAFMHIKRDYIEVISRMFFIRTFKYFVSQMIKMEDTGQITWRYLSQKPFHMLSEPILNLEPGDDLAYFAHKVSALKNKDLNLVVLDIFAGIKTFDPKTYIKYKNFVEEFKKIRGDRISPEEHNGLNKARANLMNIGGDLKLIEQGNTHIKNFMEKPFPDYDLLTYILKNHQLAFFAGRHQIIERIKTVFKLSNDIDAYEAIKFFHKYPAFCSYFSEEIAKAGESANYLLKEDAAKLSESMPGPPRFVVMLDDPLLGSCFEDQLGEIIPEFAVSRDTNVEANDILITETHILENLARDNQLKTRKLFVLLRDKDEFGSIRELKPKAFPPPPSFYKVVKAIIANLFPLDAAKTNA